MMKVKIDNEVMSRIQNTAFKSPSDELVIIARIINTAVSVKMVPPMAVATDECLDRPNRLMIGYATRVCVANILAVSKLAIMFMLSIYLQIGKPNAIGIIKVMNPNVKLLVLYFLNCDMSSSSPAINIMYKSPISEKSLIEPLPGFSSSAPINPIPLGPMITPEIIKPIMEGILNFLRTIGESKMINNIAEKIRTSLCHGN